MFCKNYAEWLIDWTERLRKWEEEEQMKKLAAEAAEEASELNVEKLDDALQLFDKPGQYSVLSTDITGFTDPQTSYVLLSATEPLTQQIELIGCPVCLSD